MSGFGTRASRNNAQQCKITIVVIPTLSECEWEGPWGAEADSATATQGPSASPQDDSAGGGATVSRDAERRQPV